MKKQFKLRIRVLLAMLLMASMFTACSSAKGEEAIKQEVQQTEVNKENAEEVLQPTPEPTPELTTELTPEPTPEPTLDLHIGPISYEEIDMESTLPGQEWMETFEGIIEEPKFVIFNDETNKKIIVENEQEAEFSNGDCLSVYTPNNIVVVLAKGDIIYGTSCCSSLCTQVMVESFAEKTIIEVSFLDLEISPISATIIPSND